MSGGGLGWGGGDEEEHVRGRAMEGGAGDGGLNSFVERGGRRSSDVLASSGTTSGGGWNGSDGSFGTGEQYPRPTPSVGMSAWTGIFTLVNVVYWRFSGWGDVSFMAGEIMKPGKTVNRVMRTSLIIILAQDVVVLSLAAACMAASVHQGGHGLQVTSTNNQSHHHGVVRVVFFTLFYPMSRMLSVFCPYRVESVSDVACPAVLCGEGGQMGG